MTPLVIMLVLVSAIIHAGWNLLSKQARPDSAFFLLTSGIAALWLAPLVLWQGTAAWASFTPAVVGLALASGASMALYYVALAAAYRAGDMSLAYPLARALPVLLVTGFAMAVGRGQGLTPRGLAGILLVVLGSMLVSLTAWRWPSASERRQPTIGLAVLAAIGSAGYALLDSAALRRLAGAATDWRDHLPHTLAYLLLEAVAVAGWLALVLLVSARRRAGPGRALAHALLALRGHWRWRTALAGVAILGAYCLVLLAFGLTDKVSYVLAFRQVGIPLGAALAFVRLREPPHPPRVLGIGLLVGGLVLVALG